MATVARQQLMTLSDERDQWHRLVGAAWCEGYRAGELAHVDDYARGVVDGAAARKRAEHDLVEWAQLELLRWGPDGAEHFGDPRPGDFPGRPAE